MRGPGSSGEAPETALSRRYRLWTRQQVVDAILALEAGVTAGQAQIAYPNAGSIVWTDYANAKLILRDLDDRLDTIDGAGPPKNGGVRFIRVLPFG